MDEENWDAAKYDESYSFVHEYADDLVDLLSPVEGERILDLGCGTGHLTAEIAEAGAVAVGVESAPDMVRTARAEYPDLAFCRGDARALPFGRVFDAVFSNAVLHWIGDAAAVVAAIYGVLRPGGRVVAEFGGAGNVSTIVDAVVAAAAERGYEVANPWYFPTVGEYAALLERAGFEVTFAHRFDRPTLLNGGEAGLREWLQMFGNGLLSGVPDYALSTVLDGVEARTRGPLFDADAERWTADYTRLRVVARRPD